MSASSTNLKFHCPITVTPEIGVINFAHRVYVFISDLLCNVSLVRKKKLIKEPAKDLHFF